MTNAELDAIACTPLDYGDCAREDIERLVAEVRRLRGAMRQAKDKLADPDWLHAVNLAFATLRAALAEGEAT